MFISPQLKRLITSNFGMTLILIFLIISAVISAFLAGTAVRNNRELQYFVSQKASAPVTGAILKTTFGDIEIKFDTPAVGARDNFIKLAKQNFYDGLRFHRVVAGLAVQSGDPLSRNLSAAAQWGSGGPGYSLPLEIASTDQMLTGSVIMARDNDQSHGSQFMILVADTPWLIGHNTQFATVTAGQEVADTISRLSTGVTGIPAQEVWLVDVQLK